VNCRRVSNLLSAYLDAELTGSEMLEIGEHLEGCAACRTEYQTLRETKHLLAALALQGPREEFEALLRAEVARAASPAIRWLPGWLLAWQGGALSLPRPRPLTTAAFLSVAAVLFVTATLDTPSDKPVQSARAATPDSYLPLVDTPLVSPASLSVADRTPLTWNPSSPVMLATFDPGYGPMEGYR